MAIPKLRYANAKTEECSRIPPARPAQRVGLFGDPSLCSTQDPFPFLVFPSVCSTQALPCTTQGHLKTSPSHTPHPGSLEDSSSAGSPISSRPAVTPNESAPTLPSTSSGSSSTSPPRYWSWRGTQREEQDHTAAHPPGCEEQPGAEQVVQLGEESASFKGKDPTTQLLALSHCLNRVRTLLLSFWHYLTASTGNFFP
ncbi:hypothetical protein Taro_003138 [Colocasia esculenta]|uniref:Uncharacterized protein n=1 Tax=Colocasia esculenta TaxID=4460 RepID=A0A843TG46_COLES|nr:hypothetical protein [Colocasia esculenta]